MLVVALVLVRLLNLVGLLSIAGCGLCVEPIELFLRVIVIVINISIAIDGDTVIVIVIMVVCTMQTAQNSIAG